ncbi:MAG: hypothetical protein AseanaTS_04410 [Candidatus Pelagadaptatus aseana]|uniref:hypothetical protein n=1 Tax=Candidatus Pelagadaptatus aseana TaxID=3120508 RepID=UPI0039B1DF30
MRNLVVISVVLALMGCEPKSVLRQIPDHELAERRSYCLDHEPTAPGKAQACENIRRECERRKEELGSYVCRHR